jgi:hypothetical protein
VPRCAGAARRRGRATMVPLACRRARSQPIAARGITSRGLVGDCEELTADELDDLSRSRSLENPAA